MKAILSHPRQDTSPPSRVEDSLDRASTLYASRSPTVSTDRTVTISQNKERPLFRTDQEDMASTRLAGKSQRQTWPED